MTILADPMYRSMMACVRERPDDDGPRLVFADWLEEQGESDRAEFIRKQIELSNYKRPPDSACHGGPDHRMYLRFMKADCGWCEMEDDIEILLTHHGQPWTLEVIPDGHHPYWPNADRWMTGCVFRETPPNMRLVTPGAQLWWRRGFVQKARMPWGKWSQYGDAILAAQPVTDVEIVGPVPIHLVASHRRFAFPDNPRTWRLREKGLALPAHATVDTIVKSLLRLEWPSVRIWSADSDQAWPEDADE